MLWKIIGTAAARMPGGEMLVQSSTKASHLGREHVQVPSSGSVSVSCSTLWSCLRILWKTAGKSTAIDTTNGTLQNTEDLCSFHGHCQFNDLVARVPNTVILLVGGIT